MISEGSQDLDPQLSSCVPLCKLLNFSELQLFFYQIRLLTHTERSFARFNNDIRGLFSTVSGHIGEYSITHVIRCVKLLDIFVEFDELIERSIMNN